MVVSHSLDTSQEIVERKKGLSQTFHHPKSVSVIQVTREAKI